MQFGLYAPVPHVTVGSPEIEASVAGAQKPLPSGVTDPAWNLSRDLLVEADKSGFDIILFAERHLGADMEAWILGSAISSLTSHIRSMIAVHPGLWHPQLVAKMAATLDRLSPGRMCLNLITGWNIEEHRMYGGETMLGDNDRYIRAEEFMHVVQGMWRETPFSYKGQFYHVEGAQLLLKPATPQPPEIFTASRSPRGLDMIAKVGDWWFLDYDKNAPDTKAVMESLRVSMDSMRERTAKTGRKVRFAFNPFICFGNTREAAMDHAMKLITPTNAETDMRKIMSRVRPAVKAGCVGTPNQVRDQIEAFREMGIELLLFKFPPLISELHQIRDKIIQPLRTQAH
jgi:FMNH2-dependent dimethyl sulfone monooxygenase